MALIELNQTSKYRSRKSEIVVTKSLVQTSNAKYDKYEHKLSKPLSTGFFNIKLNGLTTRVTKSGFRANITSFIIFFKENKLDIPIIIGILSNREEKYYNFTVLHRPRGGSASLPTVGVILKGQLNNKLDELSGNIPKVLKPGVSASHNSSDHSSLHSVPESSVQFITIDLDVKTIKNYQSTISQISVDVTTENPVDCQEFEKIIHTINGEVGNHKIKLKSTTNEFTILVNKPENQKINKVIVYYAKSFPVIPILLEIHSNAITYYKDIKKNDKGTEYNLSDITQISSNDCSQIQGFLNEIIKEVEVDIHSKEANYQNVQVTSAQDVDNAQDFKKYVHTITGTKFNKIKLSCKKTCCIFTQFRGYEYTETNLKQINFYFKKSSSDNEVPLLIEIVKSPPNHGNNDYLELKSIDKRGFNHNPEKWIKTYGKEQLATLVSTTIPSKLLEIDTMVVKKRDEPTANFESQTQDDSSGNIGLIAGVVVGLLVIGGVGGFCLYKKCLSPKAIL